MERVFADTGYWIALLNPRDDLHQKASATSRDYTPNQIVTSEMVLTEFLNSFSDYGPGLRQAAARRSCRFETRPRSSSSPKQASFSKTH